MSDSLEVFAIGSSVLLEGAISATVTAIFIRSCVCYEVVWWAEGKRQCEVVESWELLPDGEKARMRRIDPVL